jgi:hypothetical protein
VLSTLGDDSSTDRPWQVVFANTVTLLWERGIGDSLGVSLDVALGAAQRSASELHGLSSALANLAQLIPPTPAEALVLAR